MLTLCGSPISNYYNKVKMALLEKAVPFSEALVPTKSTDEAVLCHSPLAKIPFIRTPQGGLCESQAIMEYINAAYPSPPLLPADPFAAAKVRELITFIDLHLELVVRDLYPQAFFGGTVSESSQVRVRKQLEKNITAFKRLARFAPFVAGDAFTQTSAAPITTCHWWAWPPKPCWRRHAAGCWRGLQDLCQVHRGTAFRPKGCCRPQGGIASGVTMSGSQHSVDGIEVHVEGEGSQTIVMIHGWPDTHRLWDETVEGLKSTYRCVRFTLPGFDITQSPRPTSLAQMTALFSRIVSTVSPDKPVVLLLHDWGCLFGYEFAAPVSGAGFTAGGSGHWRSQLGRVSPVAAGQSEVANILLSILAGPGLEAGPLQPIVG